MFQVPSRAGQGFRHGAGRTLVITVALLVIVCLLSGAQTGRTIHAVEQKAERQRRIAEFVIGISSGHRPGNHNYIQPTLQNLSCGLQSSQEPYPRVLVFNAEVPATKHKALMAMQGDPVWHDLQQKGLLVRFGKEMHPELVAANASGGLPPSFGDSPERIWWRSKEALDTAATIEAALQADTTASYYIHFQDDIRVAAGFLDKLRSYLAGLPQHQRSQDFISMYSSGDYGRTKPYINAGTPVGMVAFCIPRKLATGLARHIREKFYTKPVDWLMEDYRVLQNSNEHVIVPNLVQHQGGQSTLAGKTYDLKRGSATFQPGGC